MAGVVVVAVCPSLVGLGCGAPEPHEPEQQGDLFDFSQVCDAPDGADVPDGERLWTDVWVWGTEPVIADLVNMWPSDDPFVLDVIVRPGSGPAATAAVCQVYAGPLRVVERDSPTQAEMLDRVVREAIPLVTAYSDWQRGVVVALLWAVEPASTAYTRDRWGDGVETRGSLHPVDA